jgi:hypothetical protein
MKNLYKCSILLSGLFLTSCSENNSKSKSEDKKNISYVNNKGFEIIDEIQYDVLNDDLTLKNSTREKFLIGGVIRFHNKYTFGRNEKEKF